MKFRFQLERAKGGYHFDEDNLLHPTTWFEEPQTEEVIHAREIHKTFLEVLHPYHDLVGLKKAPKDYKEMFVMLDKKSPKYNSDLETEIKNKIIVFADEYGLGIGDAEFGSSESINPDHSDVGFIGGVEWGKAERPNLLNVLAVAVEMNGLLLDRNSYETVPPRLKEICNIYSGRLRPRINGGLYMETSSIWTTMYWGMAFTEFTYEVKECEWCEAPLLADKRAKFCKAPRQCKNNFNNPNRKKKKESK